MQRVIVRLQKHPDKLLIRIHEINRNFIRLFIHLRCHLRHHDHTADKHQRIDENRHDQHHDHSFLVPQNVQHFLLI